MGKGRSAWNEAQHIEKLERQARAVALRKMGFSYTEIAKDLDVTKQAAFAYVKEAIAELKDEIREDSEDVKELELQRLDAMLVRLWRSAMPSPQPGSNYIPEPDTKSMKLILEVMDRRSRLMGLDAAQRVEHVTIDVIDKQIMELEQKLQQAPKTTTE